MNQEEKPQAESPLVDDQKIGFEEQLLQAFVVSGQIDSFVRDKILQRPKEEMSLSDALKEYDAIPPEVLRTLSEGQALVEQGTVSISQFMVALYDYQCANIPIKESLLARGWLNQ